MDHSMGTTHLQRLLRRPVRWSSSLPGLPGFDGREMTLEIFDVRADEQRPTRRALRSEKAVIEARLGEPIRLIFHTPEETTRLYPWVRPDLFTDISGEEARRSPLLESRTFTSEGPMGGFGQTQLTSKDCR